MTVQELINGLSKLENKQATIHIVVGDENADEYDTTAIELFSDHTDDDYQDIFAKVTLNN